MGCAIQVKLIGATDDRTMDHGKIGVQMRSGRKTIRE